MANITYKIKCPKGYMLITSKEYDELIADQEELREIKVQDSVLPVSEGNWERTFISEGANVPANNAKCLLRQKCPKRCIIVTMERYKELLEAEKNLKVKK